MSLRWMLRAWSVAVAAALMVGAVPSASFALRSIGTALAAEVATAAPTVPVPLEPPDSPIVAPAAAGYLPGSSEVSPDGEFSYAIPIDVPAGRLGMAPKLTLTYSSRRGNGLFGVGWDLAGMTSSIARCGKARATEGTVTGVAYDATDRYCLNGQKLIAVGSVNGGSGGYGQDATQYRTETDAFAQIISKGPTAPGPDTFVVNTKDGRVRTYEARTGTRVRSGVKFAPGPVTTDISTSSPRTVWLLAKESDRSGNEIRYEYSGPVTQPSVVLQGSEYQLDRIHYTYGAGVEASRYVEFEYENRGDFGIAYQGGVRYREHNRVKAISMYAPNPAATELVWKYNLGYKQGKSGRSLLTSVAKCGRSVVCLKSKQFGWHDAAPSFSTYGLGDEDFVPYGATESRGSTTNTTVGQVPLESRVADVDGDGTDDLVYHLGGRSSANYFDPPAYMLANMANYYIRRGTRNASSVNPLAAKTKLTQGTGAWPGDAGNVVVSNTRPIDLDGDGHVEISYGGLYGSAAQQKTLRWDTAANKFVDTGEPGAFPGHIDYGDVNADGLIDRVAASAPPDSKYTVSLNTNGTLAAPGATHNSGVSAAGGCKQRIGDTDGDGRAELITHKPFIQIDTGQILCGQELIALRADDSGQVQVVDGTTWYGTTPVHRMLPFLSGYETVQGDFNGDGLADAVLVGDDPGQQQALLVWGTGNGLNYGGTVVIPRDVLKGVRAADINSDGRDDLVSFYHTALSVNAAKTQVIEDPSGHEAISLLLSNGAGGFSRTDLNVDAGTPDPQSGWQTSQLGDFNGDGLADIIKITDDQLTVLTQQAPAAERLWTVRDQGTNWDRETVTYSTAWTDDLRTVDDASCGHPRVCVRRGLVVVRKLESRAHYVNPPASVTPYTRYYSYANPVADVRRGFLGFSTFQIWDPQRPAEVITEFDNATTVNSGKYYPFAFRPSITTTVVPISTLGTVPSTAPARITRTRATYDGRVRNNGTTYSTVPSSASTVVWEQDASHPVSINWAANAGATPQHVTGVQEPSVPLRRVDETFGYDEYGNQRTHTSDTTGGTRLEQVTEHDNRIGNWLITLPTTHTVTDFTADRASSVTRHREHHYDSKGRLDAAYQEKDNPDPLMRRTTTYGYDGNGLQTSVTVSAPGLPNRVSHTEYATTWPGQPNEMIYPSQTWAEHDKTAYRPSTWSVVHPAYGVVVATEDANGVISKAQFDEFGRPVKTMPAGAAATTLTYAPRPDSAGGTNGTVVTASTASITTTATTDAMARAIGGSVTGFGGTVASSSTTYDVLGRVAAKTEPAPVGTTKHVYDSLDRELTTTLPDSKTVTNTYTTTEQESVAKTVDPAGDQKDLHYDRNGRLTSSIEWLKASASTPEAVTTAYRYAPFDLVDQVTDDAGHTTTTHYDVLGRRYQIDDPDAGTTVATYYGTGDLLNEYNTAGGHSITNTYDDLGRRTQSVTEDGTSTFVFDTAAHGIGSMAWATSPDSVTTAFRYDAAGRRSGTDITDGSAGRTYRTDVGYDPSTGRQTSLTYPQAGPAGTSRFAVQHGYNTHGYLETLKYVAPGQSTQSDLWTVTARTATLALDTALLATTSGAITVHTSYDNPTGRLGAIDASYAPASGVPTSLLHVDYDYYADGQVSDRHQNGAAGKRDEHYTYDTLDRLTDWMLIPPNNDETNTHYAYDTIGNLTGIGSDHGVQETRGYGKPNGTQPHTLTGLTSNGATSTYSYDPKGRQVSGGGRSDITYNWHNLPKKITKNGQDTTFLYDAFGTKVKETRPDGATTFYVPGLYEERTTPRNGTTHVFYVSGPEGPIAQVGYDGATTTVQYQLADLLGSVVASADTAGALGQAFQYDPWGARLNPDGTPFTGNAGAVTHGYTGHEHDDPLGLINMKGRYFDPATKRFISPDPVVSDSTSSQAWNPYAYVRNNPTNRVDPSGHRDGAAWSAGFDASPPGFAGIDGPLFDYYGSSAESRGSGSAWPDVAAMVWWWNRHSQNAGANSPAKADETGAKPSAVSSNPTANGPDSKSMLKNTDIVAGLRPDCRLFCEDSLALADGDGTAGMQTPEEATGQTPPPSAADYAKYGAISLGGAVATWAAAVTAVSGYGAAAALCMRNVIACVNLPGVLYALAGVPGGPSGARPPTPKGLTETVGWLAKAKGEPAQLAFELAKRLTAVRNNSGWWSYDMGVAKTGEYLFYGSGRLIVVGTKGNWIGPVEAKVVDGLGFVVNYDILKRLQ